MKEFYLVTTQHLESRLWFLDESDYVTGMNYVAIQVCYSDVLVLAFILMSNHVHFVVYGERREVTLFTNGLKGRYSQYYQKKYGVKEFLRRNKINLRKLGPADETLEKAVAYVLMNSVAANICSHPSQYAWGTGNAFFNGDKSSSVSVGELSKRKRSRLFHSEQVDLPPSWKVGEAGFVLPESYIQVQYVENLFRTPKRMNYFLINSSKARRRLDMSRDNRPAFRDQIIMAAIPDLCRSLFQKNNFQDLTLEEKEELMRQLRFRFCADVHQIARVVGLGYEDAAKMLDNI